MIKEDDVPDPDAPPEQVIDDVLVRAAISDEALSTMADGPAKDLITIIAVAMFDEYNTSPREVVVRERRT